MVPTMQRVCCYMVATGYRAYLQCHPMSLCCSPASRVCKLYSRSHFIFPCAMLCFSCAFGSRQKLSVSRNRSSNGFCMVSAAKTTINHFQSVVFNAFGLVLFDSLRSSLPLRSRWWVKSLCAAPRETHRNMHSGFANSL